ncbi:MAG: M36 family metallopeptidase, partial [Saprospiraceae bacterium]
YPYSTDMTVNPMTYASLSSSEIRVPHGVGAVWATMLWDLTWAMIDKYGLDADLYNGTGGNNRTMGLIVESLKLQACSPGFVDGRDAILAADRLLYGGDNQCLIWEVFARRGLGYSANQGSTSSKSDGIAAFDMPPSCTISLVKTADRTTAALGDTVTYTLNAVNQQNNTLDSLVFTDFLPATLAFISASDNGQATNQIVTWPAITLNAGESATRTIVARINSELIEPDPLFVDDLEDEITNWEVTNDGGTATWIHQNTKANSGTHAFHSPGAQPNSYANLTSSTSFGLTENSELIFHHYYDIESEWDAGVVQISTDNGAEGEDIGSRRTQNGYTGATFYGFSGFHGASMGWVETKIDLSDFAFRKVLIRFQMRYDESVFEEGWFIDDITVTNIGLSAVNNAQIGNKDITTTASVNRATAINFVSHNCFNSFNSNFNATITPNEYRFAEDLAVSGVVKSGDKVGFYSGISVTLLPGFAAANGSDVIIAIEACKDINSSKLTVPDSIITTARTNTRINLNQSVLENKLTVRPNPFSEQAIIDYHLAAPGNLWIGLHDITGKVVKVLYHQTDSAVGDYQLLLDREDLENGAYWLTMRTQNDLLTKKLFLIRH